ncbi:MAG TPA: hypothetical protein VK660_03380, partial [Xanthomonadaceae bacterium]|nr:hypothetical protein [Xanthomonadaceae bacterium]
MIEHNPLTRWMVAHCEFDDDAILLWPKEVKPYFVEAGLKAPRLHPDFPAHPVAFARYPDRARMLSRRGAVCVFRKK